MSLLWTRLLLWFLSQSVCLWYMGRLLILQSATLLKVFNSSRSFLVRSLESPLNRIMPSASRATLSPSFPVCIPFISFSYLADLTRTEVETLDLFLILVGMLEFLYTLQAPGFPHFLWTQSVFYLFLSWYGLVTVCCQTRRFLLLFSVLAFPEWAIWLL